MFTRPITHFRPTIPLLAGVIVVLLSSAAFATVPVDSTKANARVDYISVDSPGPQLPKIGIAFSGGGARGFAELGVLKVIEEAGFHAEIVTGTSMGSIIGGLYAMGFTTAQLESLIVTTDWTEVFNDRPYRRNISMEQKSYFDRYVLTLPLRESSVGLPSGLIAGQRVSSLLDSLTLSAHGVSSFDDLYRKFACVATDLTTGTPVVIRNGSLSRAMRASMAIPSVFTPVELDSFLLVDGMLARNLPVEDCWNLGADYVIAIDAGSPLRESGKLNDALAVLDQSIAIGIMDENQRQQEMASYLLRPDLSGYTSVDFIHARELIQIGEDYARIHLPRLRMIADSLYSSSRRDIPPRPLLPDSVFVDNVIIHGLENVTRAFVLDEARLKLPGWVTQVSLHRAVERIYSTRFFERASYELFPHEHGCDLHMYVAEKDVNLVRFGFRYDTAEEAALLGNLTLRNPLLNATMFTADLRLGTPSSLQIGYFGHTRVGSSLGFRLSGTYLRDEISIPPAVLGNEVALESSTLSADLFVGTLFSTTTVIGIGARFDELLFAQKFESPNPIDEETNYGTLYASLQIDTFDNSYFAREGLRLQIESRWSGNFLYWNQFFQQTYASFDWRTHIHDRVTLIRRGFFQYTDGDIPLPRYDTGLWYWDFVGTPPEFLFGKHIQVLEAGIMIEPVDARFVTLRFDVGNTFLDDWNTTIEWDRYEWGIGLFAGMPSPIGPIEALVAHGTGDAIILALSVGYFF